MNEKNGQILEIRFQVSTSRGILLKVHHIFTNKVEIKNERKKRNKQRNKKINRRKNEIRKKERKKERKKN